jgi:1-acyl-sn-glycerol-3-phosphate acyltransferase
MTGPSKVDPSDMSFAERLVEPLEALIDPVFTGTEHLPTHGPMLLVGNHSLGGLFDPPFLFLHVWRHRGVALRALGDHAHFKVPVWREWVARMGVVDGTRDNCAALMADGQAILVYPGGAREVVKSQDELYTLLWKKRTGFARMALDHGCPIVPFGAVGVEDALDIVYDVRKGAIGKLARKVGFRDDLLMPIVKGVGVSPLPRPERLYFGFGRAIDPALFGASGSDDQAAWALREAAREGVEQQIAALRTLQGADPDRHLHRRVLRDAMRSVVETAKRGLSSKR